MTHPLHTSTPPAHSVWIGGAGVFCLFALLFTLGMGPGGFNDLDPLWHIAAGDLIRATGALPGSDTWSFSAGDYRWLDISWGWDTAFSFLREKGGWNAALNANHAILALTIALIYAASVLSSGNGLSAIFSTLGAMTLLYATLRPQQMTQCFVALWFLILSQHARGQCHNRWLLLLPLSMILWVNSHGGFILGPLLLDVYFLHAVWHKRRGSMIALAACALAAIATAILCNPYGMGIVESVRRPLLSNANRFIMEWRPYITSWAGLIQNIYAVLFMAAVMNRPLPVPKTERWLAYGSLILAATCVRYFSVFTIFAAPLVACRLNDWLSSHHAPAPFAEKILAYGKRLVSYKYTPCWAVLGSLLLAALLPTTLVTRHQQQPLLPEGMEAEITFIDKYAPDVRFINDFALGGLLIYETRGRIPAFIDPRAETAYPPQVIEDYSSFVTAEPGWEAMLARYGIKGVITSPDNHTIRSRLDHRAGWKLAFTGPAAAVYLKQE